MSAGPAAPAPTAAGPRSRWPWLWLVLVTPALRLLVIRFSVPAGQPWRTACPQCTAPLSAGGPAWRALSPAGRCGRCGQRLGAAPGAVEVCTVAAVAVAAAASPDPLVAAAAVWWVLCAIPLVFIDLAVLRVPNPLTYGAAGGVFVLLGGAAAVSGDWQPWWGALVSAAVAGVFFLGLALAPVGRGVGLGDVKLAVSVAGLTGWWGWGAAFAALFLAFVLLGISGAVLLFSRRATRQSHMPWGPQLVAGAVAMLALLAVLGPA